MNTAIITNVVLLLVLVGSVYLSTMAPFPLGTLLCIVVGSYALGSFTDRLILYR